MALGYDWTEIAKVDVDTLPKPYVVKITCRIFAKLNRQDIANNYSVIDTQLRTEKSNNAAGTGYNFTLSGSGGLSGSGVWTFSNTTVLSGQLTEYHASDGTKNTTLYASVYNKYLGINTSFNGSVQLPTIPRKSKPSIVTKPNTTQNIGAIGSTVKIYTNRKSTAFTHTLKYTFGSLSGTIATGVTDEKSWTIPTSFYSQIPEANSGTGSLICETYNGSALIGSESISFTVSVTNSNPTFTNFDFAETQTTSLTGSTSRFIKGYSDVRITISDANKAVGKNSATMKSYQTTIGTKTTKVNVGTYPLTYTLTDVDGATVSTLATDSRGNSTTVNKTATLITYNPITYSAFTLTRQNSIGIPVTLYFKAKFHKVNFGAVTNSIKSIKYFYKPYGSPDSSYVQGATTLTPTYDNDGNITINQSIRGDVANDGFNQNNSYTIKIEIVDELLNVYGTKFVATQTLGSGSPAIAVKGNSVALGRNYDESAGGRVQITTEAKTYLNGGWRSLFIGNFINSDIIEKRLTNNTQGYLYCGSNGVTEVGKYLDFHEGADNVDFKTRLQSTATSASTINLPNTSGTLQLTPTSLYNNTDGTNTTVTLSQNVSNFEYIEVFYGKNKQNSNGLTSTKIPHKLASFASLFAYARLADNAVQIISCMVTISGTTITRNFGNYNNDTNGTQNQVGVSSELKIYRVIGWK